MLAARKANLFLLHALPDPTAILAITAVPLVGSAQRMAVMTTTACANAEGVCAAYLEHTSLADAAASPGGGLLGC